MLAASWRGPGAMSMSFGPLCSESALYPPVSTHSANTSRPGAGEGLTFAQRYLASACATPGPRCLGHPSSMNRRPPGEDARLANSTYLPCGPEALVSLCGTGGAE